MFRPIDPLRIKHAAVASKGWEKTCDLPDPLLFKDIAHDPAGVSAILHSRSNSDCLIGEPERTQMLKVSGEYRDLHHLDAYARIGMKVQATTAARHVEAEFRRGRNRVLHCRMTGSAGSWRINDFRSANRTRRQLAAGAERFQISSGRGHIDVRRHFDTVDLDSLERTLRSTGLDEGSLAPALGPLRQFQKKMGVTAGIPVGPEVSGLFGTAVLLPLDRKLRQQCEVAWRRYVDDIDLYCHEPVFEDVVGLAAGQLALSGQQLNEAKSTWAEWGEPLDDEVSMDFSPGQFDNDQAREQLLTTLFMGQLSRLGSALDSCRAKHAEFALGVARDLLFIPNSHPQHIGRLVEASTDRDFVGDFVEWAIQSPDLLSIAKLHIARAYRDIKKGAEEAKWLYGQAWLAIEEQALSPMVGHLLAASNSSDESSSSRRKRVFADISDMPGFEAQRAAIGTLTKNTPSKADRASLTGIAQANHLLSPVCALHLSR